MISARTKGKKTPVPPPVPGSPGTFETLRRWAVVQLTADATSVTLLSLVTKLSVPELFLNPDNSYLLWTILGPALITFGGVWRRITSRDEAPNFDEDWFVQKLGGPDAVRALRYVIAQGLTVKAK